MRSIVEVSNGATNTARKILALREEHRHLITENFGRAAGNGHRLLEYVYEHPIVAVSDVQRLTGTTYPAANNLVARMVNNRILSEFTGQTRNRMFQYQSYIDLFHKGTEFTGG